MLVGAKHPAEIATFIESIYFALFFIGRIVDKHEGANYTGAAYVMQ